MYLHTNIHSLNNKKWLIVYQIVFHVVSESDYFHCFVKHIGKKISPIIISIVPFAARKKNVHCSCFPYKHQLIKRKKSNDCTLTFLSFLTFSVNLLVVGKVFYFVVFCLRKLFLYLLLEKVVIDLTNIRLKKNYSAILIS